MSNSDDIRIEYGQATMNVMDAMNDDTAEALEQLHDAASTLASHFKKHGVPAKTAAGLVVGVALDPFTRF